MLDIVIPVGFQGRVTDWSADDVRAEMGLRMAREIGALVGSGGPVDRQQIRDLALKGNLLTSETSLVFIGAEGEATGVLPAMRKLALVDATPDVQAVPPKPSAVEPEAIPEAPEQDSPTPGRSRGLGLRWPGINAPAPLHIRLANCGTVAKCSGRCAARQARICSSSARVCAKPLRWCFGGRTACWRFGRAM
jgi:hypothetical protein